MKTRQEYVDYLWNMKPVLEAFVSLPDPTVLPEETINGMAEINQHIGEAIHIVTEIDRQLAAGKATPEENGITTLDLMKATAKHLCERENIEIFIEQPIHGYKGLCTFSAKGQSTKIQISPSVVWDGDEYMYVFLHEVAHAKLHEKTTNPDAQKLEVEADAQAKYWHHFAKTHSYASHNAGGATYADNYLRLQLYALLGSREPLLNLYPNQ